MLAGKHARYFSIYFQTGSAPASRSIPLRERGSYSGFSYPCAAHNDALTIFENETHHEASCVSFSLAVARVSLIR